MLVLVLVLVLIGLELGPLTQVESRSAMDNVASGCLTWFGFEGGFERDQRTWKKETLELIVL